MKRITLIERMTRVETLLINHLAHHEFYTKWIFAPILTGTFLGTMVILFKLFHGGE